MMSMMRSSTEMSAIPMLMPARSGMAYQRGERGSGIGERVDTDAEPRDAVAARHSDEAEEQDDAHLEGREPARDVTRGVDARHRERAEVHEHDGPDEDPEEDQELALLEEIGLAGLVDQLRDLGHGLMDRETPDSGVGGDPEHHAQDADDEPEQEKVVPVQPAREGHRVEVRQREIRLASLVLLRERRRGGGEHGDHAQRRQHDHREYRPTSGPDSQHRFSLDLGSVFQEGVGRPSWQALHRPVNGEATREQRFIADGAGAVEGDVGSDFDGALEVENGLARDRHPVATIHA
jgi:hypothetical protein